MLVCNVSLRPPRSGITADLVEAVSATDATATGNVVFATLVDDPASVLDFVDAYTGAIMLEATMTTAETVDGTVVPAGGAHSAEAVAFLARTSGLDTTHTNAYYDLIDGLVADGLWSKFDVLHIYATQNSTTALLNLVSSSYPGTVTSPSFTADRGFSAPDTASSGLQIDTGFNPGTASSPKYVLNSAHVSAWNLTNITSSRACVGALLSLSNGLIYARFTDGNFYGWINSNGGGAFANSDSRGHYIASRSSSSSTSGYKNGASVFTDSTASNSVPNLGNMYSLGFNRNGAQDTCGQQQAMISIGSSLSSTDATNFYNRLRTYMTVVGVP